MWEVGISPRMKHGPWGGQISQEGASGHIGGLGETRGSWWGGGEVTMHGEVGRGELGAQDDSTEDLTGLEASQRQEGPGGADSWAENPGPG